MALRLLRLDKVRRGSYSHFFWLLIHCLPSLSTLYLHSVALRSLAALLFSLHIHPKLELPSSFTVHYHCQYLPYLELPSLVLTKPALFSPPWAPAQVL